MTTVLSTANASLPKISYLKSIDIFLVTCFVMVFCSLLEYACVNRLGQRQAQTDANTVQNVAYIIKLELLKCRTVKFRHSFIPYCLDHYV